MSEDYYKKIFSKNLKYYMALNEKTQTDIINDLGLNKSAVSTWCNGTRLPRMDKVDMLAKYFHVNRSDLIDEKPPAAPAPDEVSDDCRELVDIYTELDAPDKSSVLGYARGVYSGEKYKKGNRELSSERKIS